MDPSGTFVQCDARAIGSASEGAQSSLQEVYHKVPIPVLHLHIEQKNVVWCLYKLLYCICDSKWFVFQRFNDLNICSILSDIWKSL